MTGQSALAHRLRREVDGEVLFDAATRGRYSTDASIYQVTPIGVVVPRSADAAIAAMQIAAEEGVAILPRGAGTSLDLGDVELGTPIAISVVLNDDPACVVRAAGPVGRTGLQIVSGNRVAPGLHTLLIPEPGFWEFGLSCGEQERALSPGVMEIGPALAGKEVRFLVKD